MSANGTKRTCQLIAIGGKPDMTRAGRYVSRGYQKFHAEASTSKCGDVHVGDPRVRRRQA